MRDRPVLSAVTQPFSRDILIVTEVLMVVGDIGAADDHARLLVGGKIRQGDPHRVIMADNVTLCIGGRTIPIALKRHYSIRRGLQTAIDTTSGSGPSLSPSGALTRVMWGVSSSVLWAPTGASLAISLWAGPRRRRRHRSKRCGPSGSHLPAR